MPEPGEDDVSEHIRKTADAVHKLVNDCYRKFGIDFSDRSSELTWMNLVQPMMEKVEAEIRSELEEQVLSNERKRGRIEEHRKASQREAAQAAELEREVAEFDRLHHRKE